MRLRSPLSSTYQRRKPLLWRLAHQWFPIHRQYELDFIAEARTARYHRNVLTFGGLNKRRALASCSDVRISRGRLVFHGIMRKHESNASSSR